MNRKNLIILAEYLYNLKPDYSHFDMGTYFSGDYYEGLAYSDELEFDYSEFNRELHKCGTVACALGHAPSLADKFPEFKPKLGEDWEEYSDRVFGLDDYENTDEWEWCFGAEWSNIDNTPQGAAKRIIQLVTKGLPDDHNAQLHGEAPISYENIKLKFKA